MNSEFMAFTTDETTAEVLRRWAERQGHATDVVQKGGADLFAALLESDAAPKLAVVDLDGHENPVQIATRLAGLCGKNAHIIGLGSMNDVGFYRDILAAGFADYIVKPLTVDALLQAMTLVSRGGVGSGVNLQKEAHIVVFVGTRGGVGTTTTAVNTAWLLAHELNQKTVLVDLDLQFGNTALSLDLEPGRGLRDVVGAPQRVDALMISGALVSESKELALIGAEESLDEFIHIDASAITALFRELKPSYRCILVDLPRHLLTTQKRLLAMAHEIVLVTEMSLVGIRDTLRIQALIKGAGSTARQTIVATGSSPNRPAPVDEVAFTKGTKAKIDYILPDDHKNITAANNAGKMLGAVAAGAPLTKTLRGLARHVSGTSQHTKTEKKSLFGWITKTDTGKTS